MFKLFVKSTAHLEMLLQKSGALVVCEFCRILATHPAWIVCQLGMFWLLCAAQVAPKSHLVQRPSETALPTGASKASGSKYTDNSKPSAVALTLTRVSQKFKTYQNHSCGGYGIDMYRCLQFACHCPCEIQRLNHGLYAPQMDSATSSTSRLKEQKLFANEMKNPLSHVQLSGTYFQSSFGEQLWGVRAFFCILLSSLSFNMFQPAFGFVNLYT